MRNLQRALCQTFSCCRFVFALLINACQGPATLSKNSTPLLPAIDLNCMLKVFTSFAPTVGVCANFCFIRASNQSRTKKNERVEENYERVATYFLAYFFFAKITNRKLCHTLTNGSQCLPQRNYAPSIHFYLVFFCATRLYFGFRPKFLCPATFLGYFFGNPAVLCLRLASAPSAYGCHASSASCQALAPAAVAALCRRRRRSRRETETSIG